MSRNPRPPLVLNQLVNRSRRSAVAGRHSRAFSRRNYGSDMNYDDVVAAMFEPTPDGAVAPPTVDASPARQLRDAIEPLAMHSVWSRTTNEALAALGHNFMTSYVCSRAALLGDPTPGAVASSFAVFDPSMLADVYSAGRTICERDQLLSVRDEATIASLSAVLEDQDVGPVATLLRRGIDAAPGTGRPLYSGLLDLDWPETPVGQLWRAAELIREHRGDSHVAVCVAAGLDAVEMNVLTELWVGMPFGTYSASRSWDGDMLGAAANRLESRGLLADLQLTTEGMSFRDDLEARTDVLQQPLVDAIGSDLEPALTQLNQWSQLCIDAAAFPPNVYKRAAG